MATKIGDLFFDVYADVSKAVKNIEGIGPAAESAAKAIGTTIANAVGIAVGATALLTASVLSAGVAYNTLGQSATAAFSSIYGSASAAADILQQISTLDLTTPFKSEALVGVARTLAGFGVAKDNIIDLTSSLSQATAAMGLGSDALHRMAIAFGQIQSRGKLAGDEARQLANYGIDAYGLIADKIGLSVAAVRELGQQSKLTAEFAIPILVDAINTRFAGAIDKLSNTAAGQAEILGSLFRAVGSAIVEPFIGFSGGGAIVASMKVIQEALSSVVQVAEDGSFKLTGFLAPLTPILEDIAGAVERVATSFAGFISSIPDDALLQVGDALSGLGPVIAAVSAGLLTMFAQAIPFIGRFVAGFNPIVVGLTALVLTSDTLRASLVDTFERVWIAVQPLIPGIKQLVENIQGIAEQAIPVILDAVVTAFEDLAPAIEAVLDDTNTLLTDLGPTLISILGALADALKIVASIIGALPPDLVILTGAVYGLTVLFPTLTLGLIANSAAAGIAGGAMGALATSLGLVATALVGAYAAYLVWKPALAGLGGEKSRQDYLTSDQSGIGKYAQMGAQFVYSAWGGPSKEELQSMQDYERNLALLTETGQKFAQSQNPLGMSMQQFGDIARAELPGVNSVNAALIEYKRLKDEAMQANLDAAAATDAYTAANLFEARAARAAADGTGELTDAVEDTIKLLPQLQLAAKNAWAEVSKLLQPPKTEVIDDFLGGLLASAKSVTEALAETNGTLSSLDVGNALSGVKDNARKVIQTLAKEYGVGLDGVKALLDQRGLAAVIEALGTVTKETEKTIDPVIAKYASLGATTEQLNAAIKKLNDNRQTAIQAQIDQVSAALRDAKQAAEDARDAVAAFFSSGYIGSAQQQVDKLIGNVGNIGSNIEDALRQGGVRGAAAARSAIGDLQGQLAAIVNAGFKEGLNGQQIANLISPVLQAINEEVGQGANRISSLNFTEGITSGAGQALTAALQSGLDPGAIQDLINNILGADATVAGLENKLEGLQAALHADVEFTPSQVQGALDAISAEQKVITTTPVVTPEAAQLVYQAIQDVLSDPTNELKTTINQAIVTDQILEAAQAAEDQISLVFKSGLSFDNAELDAVARAVSDEFYAAFTDQMNQLRDQRAQEAGFDSYSQMVAALGPNVAAATIGAPNIAVNIDAPIDVTAVGPDAPRVTATQRVAGSSAAAGSGGSVPRSLQEVYGTQVIPGYRGAQ